MIGQRLPYLPPVLTGSEHRNGGALLSHQLPPDMRKSVTLFEGFVFLIRTVFKIKIISESQWATLTGEIRILGDTRVPLGMKIRFVLRREQGVVQLGGAVGEYCIEKYLLFIVVTVQNTLTHCVGKIQSSEW